MDTKQLLLIINPISGTGNKQGLAELVTERMAKIGYTTEVAYTKGRGDATALAKSAINRGFTGVLAAGGDGTVNETATALCNSDTALGIIPAGSGNGLARHLNIPIDPLLSLDVISQNNIAQPTSALFSVPLEWDLMPPSAKNLHSNKSAGNSCTSKVP